MFAFDFAAGQQAWTAGFADYPAARQDFYELVADYQPLQAPLDQSRKALFISGFNGSEDLFMFFKRQVAGLDPGAIYTATFEVEIATNIPSGCVGIPSPPGESSHIKAGASMIEPAPVLGPDGRYRMNIDKGNQASSGENAITLGNAANSLECHRGADGQIVRQWELKSLRNDTGISVRADPAGSVWLLTGIDSGAFGKWEFYVVRFVATLTHQ